MTDWRRMQSSMMHALASILKCVEMKEQYIRDKTSFGSNETSVEMKIINEKTRCTIKARRNIF